MCWGNCFSHSGAIEPGSAFPTWTRLLTYWTRLGSPSHHTMSMKDMSTNPPTTEEPEAIGIQNIRDILEKTFPGCTVVIPRTLGQTYHAEVSFFEYEIRVILYGERKETRQIHYRFQQIVTQPGERKPTKRVIYEIMSDSSAEVRRLIEETKAYLLGVVFAINKAFRPPNTKQVRTMDDLF